MTERSQPSPRVPQEILGEIIHWLAIPFQETEDVHPWDEQGRVAKATLLQCRFVSRSIHEVASNHFFRDVYITNDDEDHEKRTHEFIKILNAPGGGILRHIESLTFYFPNFLERAECDIAHHDACNSLSTILEKILGLHNMREPEDRVRRIRLSSLSIVFYVGSGTAPCWSKLTDELRMALTSVACLLPLGTLDLSHLTHVPPQIFDHLQARTLRLYNVTPLSRNTLSQTTLAFPEGPLSQPAVKTLVTNDPTNAWVPVPLKAIDLRAVPDSCNPTIISQHAASIRALELSCQSNYSAQGPLVNTLTHSEFPVLEVIQFRDDVRYDLETRRRSHEQPALLCHYHPFELLKMLRAFGTFDNAPLLERVELTITFFVPHKHVERRPRCSWDYSRCTATTTHHAITGPCINSSVQWSDLDQFFHQLLTRRRDEHKPMIKLWIGFHFQIPYKDGDPSSIPSGCFRKEEAYWREVDWPNNSVASVLPRLCKDFRDSLSYSSSFSILPE